MSYADDSVDQTNNSVTKKWLPSQRNLIILVKNNPITYLLPRRPSLMTKAKWETAWKEIASQLCQSAETCKLLWSNIKYSYAMVVKIINAGKITKEVAMAHPETSRYFDGLLSFMNPFLSQISVMSIPSVIQKSINDMFKLKKVCTNVAIERKQKKSKFISHTEVKALLKKRQLKEGKFDESMKYLQQVVDSAVKLKLGELLQLKNDLSTPNDDTINLTKQHFPLDPHKVEENTTKHVNLGLDSELIINDDIKQEDEDDIKTENDDDTKIEDEDYARDKNSTLENNVNSTVGLEKVIPSTEIIMHNTTKNNSSAERTDVISNEGNMNNVTGIAYSESISDEHIRNFCKELGDVMSIELSIVKQRIVQSQINELLKTTLMGEEGAQFIISSEND